MLCFNYKIHSLLPPALSPALSHTFGPTRGFDSYQDSVMVLAHPIHARILCFFDLVKNKKIWLNMNIKRKLQSWILFRFLIKATWFFLYNCRNLRKIWKSFCTLIAWQVTFSSCFTLKKVVITEECGLYKQRDTQEKVLVLHQRIGGLMQIYVLS